MKKTFTGPDTITYTYGYDDNNQLAVVQIPGVGLISYDEYSWNRPTAMTFPGGSTKEFSYDPLMRIESITVKDPMQTVLMDYHYTYDKADNITNKSTEHGDYIYDYDELYRLTIVDNPVLDDEAFTYDGVGNRITSADVPGDWTYNQNNELEAYDGLSFVYDDNGNTIQKNDNGVVINYVYNTENRLSRVEDGGSSTIAEYYYDSFGRRLLKDVGGTKTYFFYADEGLVGEYDTTGTGIKSYGYRPNSTWTTDPLFLKQNSNYYFYQNDHLGTPQKITDINGNVVWSAKYESFGEATVEVETVVNNLRFPGQYEDQETGLHYNGYRDYDPVLGIYREDDPIGIKGGINRLAYARNNPVVNADPLGKKCWTSGISGAAGAIFATDIAIQEVCCDGKCGVKCCTVFSFCGCVGLGATAGVTSVFGTTTSNRSGTSCHFLVAGSGFSAEVGNGVRGGVGPGIGGGVFWCCCVNISNCD